MTAYSSNAHNRYLLPGLDFEQDYHVNRYAGLGASVLNNVGWYQMRLSWKF